MVPPLLDVLVPLVRAQPPRRPLLLQAREAAEAAAVPAPNEDDAHGPPAHPADRTYWIAVGALTASTVYDIETTYATLDRCRSCGEGNARQTGVIAAGRPWAYGVQMSIDAGLAYAAYRLRKSDDPRLRAGWWLPLALVAWGHTVAGTLNATYPSR